MRYFCLFLMNMVFLTSFAQVNERLKDSIEIDSVPAFADPKYREDQFYATVSYNVMQGKPAGYSQYSFSTGLTAGFLRDMPINKRRNHSIALGLGYSYTNIKHNLIVEKGADGNIYHTEAQGSFDKNKLVLHYLEMPLELRWRNSDSISHKFWRIYAGFKVSYLLYDKAQYEPDGGTKLKIRKDDNINRIAYGAYISAGWNTWNFYAYYGLTPIYKSTAMSNGQKLELHSLNLGLIFYIL